MTRYTKESLLQHIGIIVLMIILLAAWLRLWQIFDVPPGLEYDEAYNGLDAIWMLENHYPYLFVPSNHGREALFLYPASFFIAVFGATPFALRLTSAFVGILAIPLTYRLTLQLFYKESHRYWLALVAAAGLAVSFWHLAMSRVAFRAIFIPTCFALMAYLFWTGWQISLTRRRVKRSLGYFIGAGIVLGLSQYTYLSARLFPVILFLFVTLGWLAEKTHSMRSPIKSNLQTHLATERQVKKENPALWRGLLITGLVSALIFIPLGILFLENRDTFTGRASQINFQIQWTVAGMDALARHIAQAFSVFVGGSDPRIRHHLVGWPVFNWLVLVAFWSGVVVAVKQWRRPEFFFLLISLLVMWLPGPLSVDPIHNLRTSGILPAFFIVMAVGLWQLVSWGTKKFLPGLRQSQIGLFSLALVLLIGGSFNAFNYFVRWANHPLVYQEYEGPRLELARYAVMLSETTDVILPYQFYASPPVRYTLHDSFQEELTLPFLSGKQMKLERPVVYLTLPDDPPSLFSVWLTRDGIGQKKAYLTRSLQRLEQISGEPIFGSQGDLIAHHMTLNADMLEQIFVEESIMETPFTWQGNIRLAGYSLNSPLISAGEPLEIIFFWRGLQESDLNLSIFIQLLNARDEPISQLEERIIDEDKSYYKNRTGFVYRPHLFWTGLDVSPGLYLLRIGLFDPKTGERVSLITNTGEPTGDQIILTPFYVSANGIDPRLPDVPFKASLGKSIELIGYSMGQASADMSAVSVTLYWRVIDLIDSDYTVFVQLLDQQNNIIAQHDAQPLNGLYPTSRWQPGDIISDKFVLPMTEPVLLKDSRLVTGMYDLSTGTRLPAYDFQGNLLPDGLIQLIEQ